MRYVDVVLLVIDIHKKFQIDSSTIAPISVIDVEKVNIKKIIIDYFPKAPDVSVRLTKVSTDDKNGMFRLYDKNGQKSIVINILEELNTCWRRFVTTKELVHILISRDNNTWTSNTINLIKDIFSIKGMKLDDDMHIEELAIYFALELLCPYCYNEQVINPTFSSYQIAEKFMIPEKMIDLI